MRVTDEQLANWTRPAFGNEEQLAADTEAAIRNAINNHQTLRGMDIRIVPKGSFKNNTNVRRDSDVDIAVVNQRHISMEYTDGATMAHTGLMPYTGISAADYKAAVGQALRSEFGAANVDGSGNRVFRLRGSATVMDADVIPATRYWFAGQDWHHEGIGLILDQSDGRTHFNYPDQHFDNGVAKNNRTGRRYKRSVRIMKSIENRLVSDNAVTAFPSFLIECLAYNVPDHIYNATADWRTLIMNICVHVWGYVSKLPEPADGLRWLEVNGHKYLFGPHQRWTKREAQNFIVQLYGMVTE
jgi:hypothetical protein